MYAMCQIYFFEVFATDKLTNNKRILNKIFRKEKIQKKIFIIKENIYHNELVRSITNGESNNNGEI